MNPIANKYRKIHTKIHTIPTIDFNNESVFARTTSKIIESNRIALLLAMMLPSIDSDGNGVEERLRIKKISSNAIN